MKDGRIERNWNNRNNNHADEGAEKDRKGQKRLAQLGYLITKKKSEEGLKEIGRLREAPEHLLERKNYYN